MKGLDTSRVNLDSSSRLQKFSKSANHFQILPGTSDYPGRTDLQSRLRVRQFESFSTAPFVPELPAPDKLLAKCSYWGPVGRGRPVGRAGPELRKVDPRNMLIQVHCIRSLHLPAAEAASPAELLIFMVPG
eukprot:753553-Hanusia_phi.AAC.2